MGNIFKNLFGAFKVVDDIDDDDYDEDFEDEKSYSRSSSKEISAFNSKKVENSPYQNSPFINSRKKVQEEKSNKIVSYKKAGDKFSNQVSILRPKNIKEACKACDYLADGRAVVLNLEGIAEEEAQRIMDFVFGCMYSIDGAYSQISSYVFIFVSQSGELMSDLEESVKNFTSDSMGTLSSEFEIPILRRDF